MIRHPDLGPTPYACLRALVTLTQSRTITLGGHRLSKIYGRFDCRAGKRMKPENRVFFQDQTEAITAGYRPCAACLPEEYSMWKANR